MLESHCQTFTARFCIRAFVGRMAAFVAGLLLIVLMAVRT